MKFEREAWRAGAVWAGGVDEVGVGPLAGPGGAASVALPAGRAFAWYRRTNDSKVLPAEVREGLALEIRATVPWAIGWASHIEINRINIYQARKLCMMRAIQQLPIAP